MDEEVDDDEGEDDVVGDVEFSYANNWATEFSGVKAKLGDVCEDSLVIDKGGGSKNKYGGGCSRP